MSKTLTGLFDTEEHAARAAEELERHGIPREQIAVVPALAAELDGVGEKHRTTRAHRATLGAGVGMLTGALLALLAFRLDGAQTLLAALIGAALGIALGIFTLAEGRSVRGRAFVAVRTADSKLARIAKHTLAREALDYAFEGTTVARTHLRPRSEPSMT